MGNKKTFMRNLVINALFTVIILFFCLIFTEIGLRLFSSIGPRSGYLVPKPTPEKLTQRTTVFKSNYSGMLTGRDFKIPYKVNSMGFRERELNFSELSDQMPYLFLGDSYFNGWGVDINARITNRLSERLQSQGRQLPIVNLSFPGFGTYQHLDIFKLYAPKINPRLIILGFFVGNDFIDDLNTLKFVSSTPENETFLGLYFFSIKSIVRYFLRTSPILNLIKYSLWEIQSFRYIFDKLEIVNDRMILYKKNSSQLQNEFYCSTFAAFDELAELSQTFHIPIFAVIIPDHLQVLRKELFSKSEYDISKPQKVLIEHLHRLKISYIDLLPYFSVAEDPQSLFFREDKHWSEKGHNFVANILFEHGTFNIEVPMY